MTASGSFSHADCTPPRDMSSALHPEVKRPGAVESGIEIALQRIRRIHAYLCVPAKQRGEGDPGLKASQRGAEAEVDALAKPDVGVGLPVYHEVVGLLELAFVAVGRQQPGHDQLLGRDGLSSKPDLSRGCPGKQAKGAAIPEHFLDCKRDAPLVGAQSSLRPGVLIEAPNSIAQESGGGDVTGNEKHRREADDLGIRQTL